MRNKMFKALVVAGMATVMVSAVAMGAEEENETAVENVTDLPEGAALLYDYNYEFGSMDETGWKSAFLGMQYIPVNGVTIGVEENAAINEYHTRNGVENMIAVNEMIALLSNGAYAELMVEVNPNNEAAESMFANFIEDEEVSMASKATEIEVAGKTFLSVTATKGTDTYLLGVSTDMDKLVTALKVKYSANTSRTALLNGFSEYTDVPVVNSLNEIPEIMAGELPEEAVTE